MGSTALTKPEKTNVRASSALAVLTAAMASLCCLLLLFVDFDDSKGVVGSGVVIVLNGDILHFQGSGRADDFGVGAF